MLVRREYRKYLMLTLALGPQNVESHTAGAITVADQKRGEETDAEALDRLTASVGYALNDAGKPFSVIASGVQGSTAWVRLTSPAMQDEAREKYPNATLPVIAGSEPQNTAEPAGTEGGEAEGTPVEAQADAGDVPALDAVGEETLAAVEASEV